MTSTLTLILQSGHRGCSVGSASLAKGTTCSLPLRPRRVGLSFLLLACGLPPFFGAPSFLPLLCSLLGCGLVRGLASSSPSFPSFLFFLHPVCCWHCQHLSFFLTSSFDAWSSAPLFPSCRSWGFACTFCCPDGVLFPSFDWCFFAFGPCLLEHPWVL